LQSSGGASPGFATVLNSNDKPFLVRPVLTDLTGDGVPARLTAALASAPGQVRRTSPSRST
jgi:hypothetical protein